MSEAGRKPSSRRASPRRRGVRACWRDVLALCLLAAFAAQGVVVQAHAHFRASSADTGVVTVGDNPANPDGGNGGPRNDSASCSLCQSLGAGFAPLAHTFSLGLRAPDAGTEAKLVGAPISEVGAVSYFWTSRGPPAPTPLQS
jgi:hypothetical protein